LKPLINTSKKQKVFRSGFIELEEDCFLQQAIFSVKRVARQT
jgi:hypothetical protein